MSQPVGGCRSCGGDEPFEQIHAGPCPDTGGECPEWACVSCGAAVIMGTVPAAGATATEATAVDTADPAPAAGHASAGRDVRVA